MSENKVIRSLIEKHKEAKAFASFVIPACTEVVETSQSFAISVNESESDDFIKTFRLIFR